MINTLQTLENIFVPYLQQCEMGQQIAIKCMNTPNVVSTQYTDNAVVVCDPSLPSAQGDTMLMYGYNSQKMQAASYSKHVPCCLCGVKSH